MAIPMRVIALVRERCSRWAARRAQRAAHGGTASCVAIQSENARVLDGVPPAAGVTT